MIKSIAFDLDDTLLDTTGILVPSASREAYEVMSDLKLKCDFKTFDTERTKLSKSFSHKEIFKIIADQYGTIKNPYVAEKAIAAFYNPIIPPVLPLMPGAMANLEGLKSKYNLYLVTSGAQNTQRKKIKACQIEKYFKDCFLLDGFKGERKKIAFEKIIELDKIKPEELLSIGNRLGQEIRDAKICGAQTCYFEYGEHVGEKPEQPADYPDYKIKHHEELIPTCQL